MTIRPSRASARPCLRRLLRRLPPMLLCLPLAGCGALPSISSFPSLPSRLSLPWSDPAPAAAPPAVVRTAPGAAPPTVDWNGDPVAPPRPGAVAGPSPSTGAAPDTSTAARPAPDADAGQAALDAALAPLPGDPRQSGPRSRALGEDAVAARQFRQLDADGDGALDPDEVAALPRLREAFDAADADRDGRLSFEELRRFALQQRAAREGAAAPAGAQEAPAAARAAPPPAGGGPGLRAPAGR